MLALQGARVLLVPMAWEVARSFVLDKVAAARAVENVAYLVCANQCGTVGPCEIRAGRVIADCRIGRGRAVIVADADLLALAHWGDAADPLDTARWRSGNMLWLDAMLDELADAPPSRPTLWAEPVWRR